MHVPQHARAVPPRARRIRSGNLIVFWRFEGADRQMWRDVLTTVDVKSAVKYAVEPILAT
jgi:hypothetical protein